MKTALTLDLEKTLYQYWQEQGAAVVEEVTMPDDAGIVDTLVLETALDGAKTWRCFELKVTKADFHSHAKLSFIGHYNYFVLPYKLYTQLKAEIPAQIGVLTYQPFDKKALAASTIPITTPGQLTISKPAKYQALQVPDAALTARFIGSLNREVVKAKQVEKGLDRYHSDQLYQALKKRTENYQLYQPEANFYDRFVDELHDDTIEALQEEVDALTAEIAQLKMDRLA